MASTGSQAAAMSLHQHSMERVGMVAVPGGDIHFRLYQPHQPEKAARTPLSSPMVAQGQAALACMTRYMNSQMNDPSFFMTSLAPIAHHAS